MSLVFATGARPSLAALEEAGRRDGGGLGFGVSHRADGGGWAELLTQGLTFDCRGLALAAAQPPPPRDARVGLARCPDGEAITLEPGPHLAQGRLMLPVLRGLAGVTARLAALPGMRAVVWEPAGCWVEPGFFIRAVDAWLNGGAFPALALTMLRRESDGAFASRGLDVLNGQELRLEPVADQTPEAAGGLAARVLDLLVTQGQIVEPVDLLLPDGRRLRGTPVDGGRIVSATPHEDA